MRLIDADALIRKYKTASPMAIDGRARQIVNDMPTVYPDCNISSDGTLTVTIPKGTHVGRVLVQEDGTHYGGLYYPDEDRKRGKWIEDAETYYKAVNEKGGGVNENTPYFTDDIGCSECLSLFSVIDNETERFDFCPVCGAQMEGSDAN